MNVNTPKPIRLTREEAKALATLLSDLNGRLQYKAGKRKRTSSLDTSWAFWHEIDKKVAKSFGYAAWSVPSQEVQDILH